MSTGLLKVQKMKYASLAKQPTRHAKNKKANALTDKIINHLLQKKSVNVQKRIGNVILDIKKMNHMVRNALQ